MSLYSLRLDLCCDLAYSVSNFSQQIFTYANKEKHFSLRTINFSFSSLVMVSCVTHENCSTDTAVKHIFNGMNWKDTTVHEECLKFQSLIVKYQVQFAMLVVIRIIVHIVCVLSRFSHILLHFSPKMLGKDHNRTSMSLLTLIQIIMRLLIVWGKPSIIVDSETFPLWLLWKRIVWKNLRAYHQSDYHFTMKIVWAIASSKSLDEINGAEPLSVIPVIHFAEHDKKKI